MKAKALRLPENLLSAVKFAEKKERLDEPTALRKFLRLGAERYMAELYARGDVSLREAAGVLAIPAREVLEVFWDMGVGGNVGSDETLAAISAVEEKIPRKSLRSSRR